MYSLYECILRYINEVSSLVNDDMTYEKPKNVGESNYCSKMVTYKLTQDDNGDVTSCVFGAQHTKELVVKLPIKRPVVAPQIYSTRDARIFKMLF